MANKECSVDLDQKMIRVGTLTFMPCHAPARRWRHPKEGMSCGRKSG
jgi:hypothetical protein